jgi:hypothetical protein
MLAKKRGHVACVDLIDKEQVSCEYLFPTLLCNQFYRRNEGTIKMLPNLPQPLRHQTKRLLITHHSRRSYHHQMPDPSPNTTDDDALSWKDKGDLLMNEKEFSQAIRCYTESLTRSNDGPRSSDVLSNRALAHLNLEVSVSLHFAPHSL